MVAAEQLRASGFSFDPDTQMWISVEGSQSIADSERINFEVDKIHEVEGNVSIEGVKPSLIPLAET